MKEFILLEMTCNTTFFSHVSYYDYLNTVPDNLPTKPCIMQPCMKAHTHDCAQIKISWSRGNKMLKQTEKECQKWFTNLHVRGKMWRKKKSNCNFQSIHSYISEMLILHSLYCTCTHHIQCLPLYIQQHSIPSNIPYSLIPDISNLPLSFFVQYFLCTW